MSLKNRVGKRIKDLRGQKKLSQEQLAELIERSVDAVSNLERGISLPNFETLERLSTALGVPVREFFEVHEDQNMHRAALLARLVDMGRSLTDRDLEVAVRQVEVLMSLPAAPPTQGRDRPRPKRAGS